MNQGISFRSSEQNQCSYENNSIGIYLKRARYACSRYASFYSLRGVAQVVRSEILFNKITKHNEYIQSYEQIS